MTWEDVGRSLLAYQFSVLGDELSMAFHSTARKARDPERAITADDVRRLDNALEKADGFVDELAKVPDDYQRPPRFRELLNPEEVQEIVERQPRNPGRHQ